MTKSSYFIVILLLLIGTACQKKELPENTVEAPIFYLEGMIDGDPLDLFVGPDDVIVESDYSVSNEGYPVFTTSLFNSECSTCSEGLFIEFVGAVQEGPNFGFEDYILLDNFDIEHYLIGQNQGLLEIQVNNPETNIVILDNFQGTPIYEGMGNASIELIDGDYVMIVFHADDTLDCLGEQAVFFSVQDGGICGSLPQIELDDETFSFNTMNSEVGDFFVTINGLEVDILPGETVFLDDILPSSGLVESLQIVEFTSSGCQLISTWNSSFYSEQLCIQGLAVEEVNINPVHEPLTARIRYINEALQTFGSIADEDNELQVLSIVPYLDDPLGREAYTIEVQVEATLVNLLDAEDVIDLSIESAFIPLVID